MICAGSLGRANGAGVFSGALIGPWTMFESHLVTRVAADYRADIGHLTKSNAVAEPVRGLSIDEQPDVVRSDVGPRACFRILFVQDGHPERVRRVTLAVVGHHLPYLDVVGVFLGEGPEVVAGARIDDHPRPVILDDVVAGRAVVPNR